MARLDKAYTTLFGSESSKGLLYAGFYTLLGGVFTGLAAIVLLFVANAQEGDGSGYYSWRTASFALAALAGALIFFGFSLTLPSKQGMRMATGVGLLACFVSTGIFAWAYPEHFNVPDNQDDYTEVTVGLYVVGIAVIIAGLFTSVIGYYLDRMSAAGGTKRGEDGGVYDEYDVPDSVIEKDIEYAMRKYRYAWGEGDTSATGVQINIKDEFEQGTVVGGKGVARTVQLEAPQVDDATKALKSIRPSKDTTVAAQVTDDLTKSLLEFRKQKAAMVEAKASRKVGWWTRFLQWLGLRRGPRPSVSQVPEHSQAPVRKTQQK